MRSWLAVLLLAVSCLAAFPGHAATDPDEILKDPALEQRARGLSKQLRCLVCQNQSIDDSDADLARDLRRIVREQLVAGKSDGEIIAYVTARYGDFVLLKPPVKPATWGLWFGPALVLVIAAGGLVVYVRARAGRPDHRPPDLNPEERRRLDALLREDSAASGSLVPPTPSERWGHQPDHAGVDGDGGEPSQQSRRSALVHRGLATPMEDGPCRRSTAADAPATGSLSRRA